MEETLITIIALLALIVTLQQLSVQRKHNRKSVLPYLVFNIIIKPESPQLVIEIKNTGLGPAFIKEVTYYVDDVPFNKSSRFPLIDILKNVGIITDKGGVTEKILHNKSAISAGDIVVFVQANTLASKMVEVKSVRSIDIKIRYESIYSESFEVRLIDDLSE